METMLCKSCEMPMKEIGPYASRQHEGEEPKKWDGARQFQCMNDDCENRYQIIEMSSAEQASHEEEMQKVCECGHAREMHGYGVSLIEPGQPFPKKEKDKKCEASDCLCEKYVERFAESE